MKYKVKYTITGEKTFIVEAKNELDAVNKIHHCAENDASFYKDVEMTDISIKIIEDKMTVNVLFGDDETQFDVESLEEAEEMWIEFAKENDINPGIEHFFEIVNE